jgi:hypothetical protein
MVTGTNSSGVVALFIAALDERFTRVKAINTLASYETRSPYQGWRMGLFAPGILREFGDIRDVAALVAPRAVTIQGAKSGDGTSLDLPSMATQFATTKRVFELLDVANLLVLEDAPTETEASSTRQ